MCKQNVVFGEYALNAESDKVMAPRRQEVQNAAVVVLARSCFFIVVVVEVMAAV